MARRGGLLPQQHTGHLMSPSLCGAAQHLLPANAAAAALRSWRVARRGGLLPQQHTGHLISPSHLAARRSGRRQPARRCGRRSGCSGVERVTRGPCLYSTPLPALRTNSNTARSTQLVPRYLAAATSPLSNKAASFHTFPPSSARNSIYSWQRPASSDDECRL